MTVWGLCFNLQPPPSQIPYSQISLNTLNTKSNLTLLRSDPKWDFPKHLQGTYLGLCVAKERKHQLCGFLRCTCQPTGRIDVRSTQSFSKVKRAIKLGYFFSCRLARVIAREKLKWSWKMCHFFRVVLQGKPLSEDVCCLSFVVGRVKEGGFFYRDDDETW